MVKQNIEEMHIMIFKDGKCELDPGFDIEQPKNSFLKYLLKFRPDRNFPFKALVDFMLSSNKVLLASKLSKAFMVYDGKETFDELYGINVIDELVDGDFSKFNMTVHFNDMFHFRKPPAMKKILENIFDKKIKNQRIEDEDLVGYDHRKDHYLRPIIFRRREQFFLRTAIERINNLSLEGFIKGLLKEKYESILSNDYLDLFNR
jgi:hypothetical protein